MVWWRKRHAPAELAESGAKVAAVAADGATSSSGSGSATASSSGEARTDLPAASAAKRSRIGLTPAGEKEIHDVQLELQILEGKCAEEQISLQMRYDRLRKPFFERRGRLLRQVPGFWTAALSGHPLRLVHPAEVSALSHLQDLELNDNLDRNGSYEVIATFGKEAPFTERSIVKRITFHETGETVEPATLTASEDGFAELLEKLGVGREAAPPPPWPPRSVLGWFLLPRRHHQETPDDFGDVLRRDLWQDPLPYYLAFRDREVGVA
eukprot:TRINITY_DN21013_c0_g1_i1.p1 TRINITY_DN21013_c0_g1~~TRINITY_DN21013_c0_g1_i1.p1  ORF type:complete len:267 (-),score=47.88 TRINITY_DN21013_c0_g1_i1:24-824(-)